MRVQQTLARDEERASQGDTTTGPNSSWPLASRVARTRPATALRIVKFPANHKNGRSTTVSHFSTLSQINPLYALPLQSILIFYYHLRLGLQSYLLTSGFLTKTLSALVFSLHRPSHSSSFDCPKNICAQHNAAVPHYETLCNAHHEDDSKMFLRNDSTHLPARSQHQFSPK